MLNSKIELLLQKKEQFISQHFTPAFHAILQRLLEKHLGLK